MIVAAVAIHKPLAGYHTLVWEGDQSVCMDSTASRTVRPHVNGERRPTGTGSSDGNDVSGIDRETLHGTVLPMVRTKFVDL